MLLERDIQFETAFEQGIKAAAGSLAEELTKQNFYEKDLDEELIQEQFYREAALSLGIEHQLGFQEKLEEVVPIIVIMTEKDFMVISPKLEADKSLKRVNSGSLSYGFTEGQKNTLSSAYRDKCIETVEMRINKALQEVLLLKGIEKAVELDLPEYVQSDYIQTITGPAVLAISFIPDPLSHEYEMKLYGAELSSKALLYMIEREGEKEIHTSNCERMKEIIERKQYTKTYESLQTAVLEGGLSQSCCNPFSAYLYNYMSGK